MPGTGHFLSSSESLDSMAMLVIVGGGFAGLEAAIQIRTLRPSCEVTLISPTANLVFKPWLIYIPAGRRRFADLCIPLAPLATRHGFRLVESRVSAAYLDARRVHLAGGESIEYSELVVATGAEADRGHIPGARSNALFPCDPEDAEKFAQAVGAQRPRSVCIAVGWDRRGPGLEFAGWLAARRRNLGLREMQVVVVDGDGAMHERYGEETTAAYREILRRRGATIHPEPRLDAVTESGAVINGKERGFDLVAIVSPARGVDIGLPKDMLDERGFVQVADTFETGKQGVFAFGDAAATPSFLQIGKTMVSIRQQVEHLAHNVLARIDGTPLRRAEIPPGPHYSMSNLGGAALVLKDNRVVGRGRLPLLRRWLYDQAYFRLRT